MRAAGHVPVSSVSAAGAHVRRCAAARTATEPRCRRRLQVAARAQSAPAAPLPAPQWTPRRRRRTALSDAGQKPACQRGASSEAATCHTRSLSHRCARTDVGPRGACACGAHKVHHSGWRPGGHAACGADAARARGCGCVAWRLLRAARACARLQPACARPAANAARARRLRKRIATSAHRSKAWRAPKATTHVARGGAPSARSAPPTPPTARTPPPRWPPRLLSRRSARRQRAR